jgi:hypothetical protein
MKTEQELLERYKTITKQLINDKRPNKHCKYDRVMLRKEYSVLHWVLFE